MHSRRAAYALASGSMLENHLAARPYAVYSPHVATPNFGMERFVTLATSVGLTPLVLEFNQDKFVTCNPEKHALARMVFHAGTGRNGGPRNRVLTLADLHAADGTAICQTTTTWGQGLVPFHHELLRSRPLLNDTEIVDGSPFFLAYSGGARHYYPDFFFALCTACHPVRKFFGYYSIRSKVHDRGCHSRFPCHHRQTWLPPAYLSPRSPGKRRAAILVPISRRIT